MMSHAPPCLLTDRKCVKAPGMRAATCLVTSTLLVEGTMHGPQGFAQYCAVFVTAGHAHTMSLRVLASLLQMLALVYLLDPHWLAAYVMHDGA